MSTAALIYLALTFLGLGIAFAQHGQPKTGNHNAGITVVGTALVLLLMWWGGFFSTGCTP